MHYANNGKTRREWGEGRPAPWISNILAYSGDTCFDLFVVCSPVPESWLPAVRVFVNI